MASESPSAVLALLAAETPLFTSEFITTTQTAALSELLDWFKQCWPSHSSPRVWLECQTALVEAYGNVLEHAHQGLPATTPILVKLLAYRKAIEIQVWDRGAAFDFAKQLEQLPARVEMTAERGRGLLLLRRTMDYLAYNRTSDDRNCLVMIRLL